MVRVVGGFGGWIGVGVYGRVGVRFFVVGCGGSRWGREKGV